MRYLIEWKELKNIGKRVIIIKLEYVINIFFGVVVVFLVVFFVVLFIVVERFVIVLFMIDFVILIFWCFFV